MAEIAALLKRERPDFAKRKPVKLLPGSLVKLAALFSRQAKEGVFMLNINRNVSNEKAKDLLGWTPIANNEEIVLASIDSMEKFGL